MWVAKASIFPVIHFPGIDAVHSAGRGVGEEGAEDSCCYKQPETVEVMSVHQ